MKKLLILAGFALLGACATFSDQAKEDIAEANFKLGIGYLQSGRQEVAAEKLLKAVQAREDYPEAHNALGVLYEEMREYNAAEMHFQRAIALKPDYILAKINLARFLCTTLPARSAEGEAIFNALAEDPAHAGATAGSAYLGLSACARSRNDLAQTEGWLRKSVEADPKQAAALFELAHLYQTQGQTLSARAFLQRHHAQTPPTPRSLALGIAIEQDKTGDPALRREYITQLMSRYPQSEEARRLKP